MQKYLNIDPTSDPSASLEKANLLNDGGPGEDDTPTGSFSSTSRNLPMQSFGSGGSHHAVNHTTHFGPTAGAGAGISTSSHGGAGVSGGYTPPNVFSMGSAYAANESEDSVNNPLASPAAATTTSTNNPGARFPTPTRIASSVSVPAPAPAVAPPASSNKNKKAMKEPKSMRSST